MCTYICRKLAETFPLTKVWICCKSQWKSTVLYLTALKTLRYNWNIKKIKMSFTRRKNWRYSGSRRSDEQTLFRFLVHKRTKDLKPAFNPKEL